MLQHEAAARLSQNGGIFSMPAVLSDALRAPIADHSTVSKQAAKTQTGSEPHPCNAFLSHDKSRASDELTFYTCAYSVLLRVLLLSAKSKDCYCTCEVFCVSSWQNGELLQTGEERWVERIMWCFRTEMSICTAESLRARSYACMHAHTGASYYHAWHATPSPPPRGEFINHNVRPGRAGSKSCGWWSHCYLLCSAHPRFFREWEVIFFPLRAENR